MSTIKDIAVKAGVSHGTVSNVLNKRGNVSAEKIQLVELVAKELGYNLNIQAQQLRAGMARKVCVIIPRISLKSYNDFYVGMESCLRDQDFSIELFCTDNLECTEEQAVKKVLSLNPMAVVLVSSFLKNKGLFASDARFFFVERRVKGMPKQGIYAGFSYGQAGRDIANRCIADGHRAIALLCENSNFSNNKEFIHAAIDVFDDHNCTYKLFPSDDHMWFNKAFDILSWKEDFDAVIAMSREDAEHLKAAGNYNPDRTLPAIYALTGKGIGLDKSAIWYRLNYKLLGRSIAEQIIQIGAEETKAEVPGDICLENDGFCSESRMGEIRGEKIRFLTIQNPTSKAIQMLLPSFTKETGIEVHMIGMSYDEHYKISQTCAQNDAYDLIRIDMAWMAELGNRIYRPFEETEDVAWLRRQILPTLSPNYSYINGTAYAFPLDACVQMLFYRKDLFEDELIKREFFERYKRRLEIPKTYSEYNEVAAFFTRRENPLSRTQYGATATFGRTFLAACDFLPRFRETGKHFFGADGYVNVETPEMKRALLGYLEACQYTGGEIYQWWGDTTRFFFEGNSAMHVVFSNYASDIIHNPDSKVVGRIACRTVPGGQPLSGGGSIGISRHTKKYEACIEFLKWLYRNDVAETITYLGGYIGHREIARNMDILELYPWIKDMEQAFETAWRISSHEKNPGFNEFLFEDILGKAIRATASGIEDIDVALQKAQKECDEAFGRRG